MASHKCNNPKISCKCKVFFVLSITTNAYGLNVLTFLHLSPAGEDNFCWTPEMDLVFKCMKDLMVQDCLHVYPNHNKPFYIYTDASSYEMGAYIIQDDKPVAFWSRKLNDAQLKYIVCDKELLFIVMILVEFFSMLLAGIPHIHTDHVNITTNNTIPDHIIC